MSSSGICCIGRERGKKWSRNSEGSAGAVYHLRHCSPRRATTGTTRRSTCSSGSTARIIRASRSRSTPSATSIAATVVSLLLHFVLLISANPSPTGESGIAKGAPSAAASQGTRARSRSRFLGSVAAATPGSAASSGINHLHCHDDEEVETVRVVATSRGGDLGNTARKTTTSPSSRDRSSVLTDTRRITGYAGSRGTHRRRHRSGDSVHRQVNDKERCAPISSTISHTSAIRTHRLHPKSRRSLNGICAGPIGVPPVQIRKASGRRAFLPPEKVTATCTTGTPAGTGTRGASTTGIATASCATSAPAIGHQGHCHHGHDKKRQQRRQQQQCHDQPSVLPDSARGVSFRDVVDESNQAPPPIKGLLRVPCEIFIDEDIGTSGSDNGIALTSDICPDDEKDYCSSESKGPHTSVALTAYVDTGAQVTVVSAEAARKAGIFHLLDRRYAGRATGIGQCRVLGRIPAGCAHFFLGRRALDTSSGRSANEGFGTTSVSPGSNGFYSPCPQLTVLEGTGTEGIDILIGLDILEEWGASICLRHRTLTVSNLRHQQRRQEYWNDRESKNSASRSFTLEFARDEPTIQEQEKSTTSLALAESSFAGNEDLAVARKDEESFRATRRKRRKQSLVDQDLRADLELLELEAASTTEWDGDDIIARYLDLQEDIEKGHEEESENEEEGEVHDVCMSGM